MTNWKAGMKAVYWERGAYPELTLNAVYDVEGVEYCCRTWLRFKGVDNDVSDQGCVYCGAPAPDGEWYEASSFRPLDALTEQVERIEKEGAPAELETVEA